MSHDPVNESQMRMIAKRIRGSNAPLTVPYMMTIPYVDRPLAEDEQIGIGFDIDKIPTKIGMTGSLNRFAAKAFDKKFTSLRTVMVFPNDDDSSMGSRYIDMEKEQLGGEEPSQYAQRIIDFAKAESRAFEKQPQFKPKPSA